MDQYFLSIYPFLVYALKISIGSYVPQHLLHLLFHTEIGWNQVNFKFPVRAELVRIRGLILT